MRIKPLNVTVFSCLPSLRHDLHEVVGQVTSSQVKTQDGVGKGVTLIDGDGVGHAIADVEDETGGTTGSVEGEDGLDAHVAARKGKDNILLFGYAAAKN